MTTYPTRSVVLQRAIEARRIERTKADYVNGIIEADELEARLERIFNATLRNGSRA